MRPSLSKKRMNKIAEIRNRAIVLIVFFLCISEIKAQVTVSGYVEDLKTGESLIGVNIVDKATKSGVVSNGYGFFSIKVPKGTILLDISYIGYKGEQLSFYIGRDTVISIKMEESSYELKDLVISTKGDNKLVSTQMSVDHIPVKKLNQIPVIAGEPDVVKVLQLLPGVQGGTEGASGIYVRGGDEDQNLFLLDDVPIYNCSHLFGFFSVFNPGSVKSVDLYKGGFPARYGGRLSSVVDIRTNDGNFKKIKGEFSIGLISSRFTIDGPLWKDKTSFLLSARRTYVDVLAAPIIKSGNDDEDDFSAGYYFYDLNGKLTHKFSDRDRLFLSVYLGKDKMYFDDNYSESYYSDDEGEGDSEFMDTEKTKMDMHWGNQMVALRWNHLFSENLFSNTTVTYSNYRFNTFYKDELYDTGDGVNNKYTYDYFSLIRDVSGKIDFYFYPNTSNNIRFGTGFTKHLFKPGVAAEKNMASDSTQYNTHSPGNSINAEEVYVYAEDDIKVTSSTSTNIGVRYSGINVQGKFYSSFQPRISVRQQITDLCSMKASYARMVQYVHLLSSSAIINMPTDLWVPVTKKLTPPLSDQFAVGVDYKFPNSFILTVEGYYKKMDNLIDYKEGASFMNTVSKNWDEMVVTGKGKSYGMEFMLEKNVGKTTGWISYTLSKSDRTFKDLNYGKTFPAKYDRRHDISLVLTHRFSKKFDIGMNWVYNTGNAVTLAAYEYPEMGSYYGNPLKETGDKNSYRMLDYHRLDFSMNFHKKKKHGIRTWNISFYNVYSRMNPFALTWKDKKDKDGNSYKQLRKVSIFPIIPSVSYSYKF